MISIVVNVDTRPEKDTLGKMFDGVRSREFCTHGIENKRNFFKDIPHETIVYVDEHEKYEGIIPADTVIRSSHRKYFNGLEYFPKFNDLNFLQALMMARGKYVAHFDGDMAIFGKNPAEVINGWINLLDSNQYDYISYPSPWSPSPDGDTKWDYKWASTRFFICRQEILDFTEIMKCLVSDNYLYGKYGEKYRRCPWLEHILGIIAGNDKVFYPPMDYPNYMVFSWSSYKAGVFSKLNDSSYEDVLAYVKQCGGIQYPCDVAGA